MLSLARNRIAELADIDPLSGFQYLNTLSLLGNPVTGKENYRLWVIWRCPSVHYLDFQRVTQNEREGAAIKFGTKEEPTALATTVCYI